MAEVTVDEALVRALLSEQHPDLAGLPLQLVANGWDNVIFRLGDELAARLPRRAMAAELVAHELRWLPALAPLLPLPVPAPVRAGRPSGAYPWAWSICPWLPGDVAARAEPADPAEAAAALAGFVAALHRPAPEGAPRNPYRGVALAGRSPSVADWWHRVLAGERAEVAERLWRAALEAPGWDRPAVWVHGDLHPGNILVHEGRLSAVIDFGDLNAGDPATDLAVAWMMLPPDLRDGFRAAAGDIDDATWLRAHGWALFFGIAISANSADNPLFAALGARILGSVLDA